MLDLISLEFAGYVLLIVSYSYEAFRNLVDALGARAAADPSSGSSRKGSLTAAAAALGYGLLCAAKLQEHGAMLLLGCGL